MPLNVRSFCCYWDGGYIVAITTNYELINQREKNRDVYIIKTMGPEITELEHQAVKIATHYSLSQNYPNPFNPSTSIKYSIPQSSNVTLKVFDVLGSEIITLLNKEQSAGNYEVEFDGSDLTSGIYFYRLQAGDFVETKKMILLK